jgi:WD40 repeat protein
MAAWYDDGIAGYCAGVRLSRGEKTMQRSVCFRFSIPFLYCGLVLLCLFDVSASIAAGEPVQDTAAQVEQGLPENAIRQFGTDRFVAKGAQEVAVCRSGNRIASVAGAGNGKSGWEISLWDAESGEKLGAQHLSFDSPPEATGYGRRLMHTMSGSGCLLVPGGRGKAIAINSESAEIEWEIETGGNEIITSVDANGDETQFAFGSANRMLVCDREGSVIFEFKHAGKEGDRYGGRDRLQHSGDFSYGRFSPDGNWLAIVNNENQTAVHIFDTRFWEKSVEISTKEKVVRMEFSPDSQSLATTERDIAARCYEVDSGKEKWETIFSPSGLDERYTSDITWHPDGNLIAVATAIGEDNRIQILDAANGGITGELAGHTWKPWSIRFDSSGSRLFSVGWDGVIRRWDMEKFEQLELMDEKRANGGCTISPDGSTVVWADDKGTVHVENVETGEIVREFGVENVQFTRFCFSPDGTVLVGAGTSELAIAAYVWKVSDLEVLHKWNWPKGRDVHSSAQVIRFSGNGRRIAIPVFRQSRTWVFDLDAGKQVGELRHPMVFGATLSADGSRCVTGGWDSTLRIWNCDSGEVESELQVADGNDPRIYDVLLSSDDSKVLTFDMDGRLRIYDEKLTEIKSIELTRDPSQGNIALTGDASRLAASTRYGDVVVVDLASSSISKLTGHKASITNLSFSADGTLLLSGADDHRCFLWRDDN